MAAELRPHPLAAIQDNGRASHPRTEAILDMRTPARRRTGWLLFATLALVLVLLVAAASHRIALRGALNQLHEAAQQRLAVEAARLDGQLARVEYLPSLLETSPEVMRLLAEPDNAALRGPVGVYLKSLNAIAGADNLYVLHPSGRALAAADQDQPGTPVGEDLSYRPYVRDVLTGGRGRFYGVGITSARAGYYLSYALPARGKIQGVATVKINLQRFESDWRELPGEVLAVDEHGVVILSSRDDWRYRPLQVLSPEARAEAAQARRYGSAELTPLDWHVREAVGHRAERIALDSAHYVKSEHPVNRGRWRLLLLADEAAALTAARTAAIIAALVAAVLILGATLLVFRQREIKQRLASREALQAAHDMLELKVQERTAELRAAQDGLVHAGKLAVLGQMSAGVVHELNQPLAALHTLSDNAGLLIERGKIDDARGNMRRIGNIVQRMARLTSQLKGFAHKANAPLRPIGVRRTIDEALLFASSRIDAGGVEVSVDVQPEGLSVMADEARLEQVLANLLGNALDALESVEERRLVIAARRANSACEIVVSNSGPCIDATIMARLFEPFVTSKPAGKGLGLGLLISTHIVRSFGGTLKARNLSPQGAEFTIELPDAAMPAEVQ